MLTTPEPWNSDPAIPSRKYYLMRGVYACRTEDGAIFLNSTCGSYLGLGPSAARAIEACVDGWPRMTNTQAPDHATPDSAVSATDAEEIANALLNRGLLTMARAHAAEPRAAAPTAKAEITFEEHLNHKLTLHPRHLLNFMRSVLVVKCRLKLASFQRSIARLQQSKQKSAATAAREADLERAKYLSNAFLSLQELFVTRTGACLFDSLCLAEFLSHYRIYPDVVIGVRTSPFTAHCWVQKDGVVLNDTVAKVTEFSPILAA